MFNLFNLFEFFDNKSSKKIQEIKKEDKSYKTNFFDEETIKNFNIREINKNYFLEKYLPIKIDNSLYLHKNHLKKEKDCFLCNNNFNYTEDNNFSLFYTTKKIKDSKYYYEIIFSDDNSIIDQIDLGSNSLNIIFMEYTLVKDLNNNYIKVFLFEKGSFVIREILKIDFIEKDFSFHLFSYYIRKVKEDKKIYYLNKWLENEHKYKLIFIFDDQPINIKENFQDYECINKIFKQKIINYIDKYSLHNCAIIDFINKENLPFNLDFHLMTK